MLGSKGAQLLTKINMPMLEALQIRKIEAIARAVRDWD